MKSKWVYNKEVKCATYSTDSATGSISILEPRGWRAEVWCLLSHNQLECEDFDTLAKAQMAVEKWVDEVS